MKINWQVNGSVSGISFRHEHTDDWHGQAAILIDQLPEHTLLGRVEAVIPLEVTGKERLFFNGYQTWTYSPEYTVKDRMHTMRALPKAVIDRYALDRYGDAAITGTSGKPGEFHGFSWCWFRKGKTFRLFASLDETPGYTIFSYHHKTGTLTIRRDCMDVEAGGPFHAFDLFYAEGNEDDVFDAWFEAMSIVPRTRRKLAGYSSWYNRYEQINAGTIKEDLDGCADILEKNDLFQIDDGWERAIGDWQADSAKFPDGMKKQADAIHKAGYCAGLWLAPFAAEKNSELYRRHQDWFLKINGENWKCGSNWSGFYSLDIDHPEVQSYLKETFRTVFDEWGFDLVKLDFLYAAAPFGNRRESRAARMKRAVDLLNTWCGDHLILACGVPLMPCFGKVDYARVSCDVSLDWDNKPYMRLTHPERVSTKQAMETTLYRRQLNGRAFLNDPDVFFLRSENCALSGAQKELLAVSNALLGGVWLTSDNPSTYTAEMKAHYRRLRKFTNADLTVEPSASGTLLRYRLDGSDGILNR